MESVAYLWMKQIVKSIYNIYNKFYIMMNIMMRYIFKAIRLYPLNKTMEEELEILEENLLQLSEII